MGADLSMGKILRTLRVQCKQTTLRLGVLYHDCLVLHYILHVKCIVIDSKLCTSQFKSDFTLLNTLVSV